MVQSAPTSASQWWIQDCAKEGGGVRFRQGHGNAEVVERWDTPTWKVLKFFAEMLHLVNFDEL